MNVGKKYYLKNFDNFKIKKVRLIKRVSKDVVNIINGSDKRFIVMLGPCSVHSYKHCIKLAKLVKRLQVKYAENILILYRVYLEKPRTVSGWKGYIYDPDINGIIDVNKGLSRSISLLKKIIKIGLPIVTEFLNNMFFNYLKYYVSVGTIGARTSESQLHREFVSSVRMPIGFKNNSYGDTQCAINSILSVKCSSFYINLDKENRMFINSTNGNPNSFLILRGGKKPNYHVDYVKSVVLNLNEHDLHKGIIIDCSHGNSEKDFRKQKDVATYVITQVLKNPRITGIMLEVNLLQGSQLISSSIDGRISITDPCMSFRTVKTLLRNINDVLNERNI